MASLLRSCFAFFFLFFPKFLGSPFILGMVVCCCNGGSNLIFPLQVGIFIAARIGQVIERHNLHPKNIDMFGQPSLELQLDGAVYAMLNKEIAEKTRELRQMRGEDLQGLNIEELQKLEKLIQGSLCRVLEEKEDKIVNEMEALKRKVMNLSAGKGQLLERGQSSDSLVTNISSMSSADLRQDSDSSCAFLTLGLPFPD